MQEDTVLQRFKKFKSMFISSNISNNLLLEMVESFITPSDDTPAAEAIPVMDGQMSLLDYEFCA